MNPAFLITWAKKANPRSEKTYDDQLKTLGNAAREQAGIAALNPDYYSNDIGLCLIPQKSQFLEV